MSSLNKLWIPTIAAVYALVFVFLLYAWEHLFGTVSSIIRPKASRKEGAQGLSHEIGHDEISSLKAPKTKTGASEKLKSDQVP